MLDDPSIATYRPTLETSAKPKRRAKTAAPAAALVEATTAAANAIAEAIRSHSSAPGCERWNSASTRLQAAWPVEGGSAAEVAECTALLLSLEPLGDARNRIAEVLASGGDEASAALAACLSAAANQHSIAAILSQLRPQVAHWLPQIEAEASQNVAAVAPLASLYESVLARFNRSERAKRGVFHTPAMVVDWMVDAASALVERHFGGSASAATATAIRVIDAGCSCGTFLSAAGKCSKLQRFDPHLLGYEVLPTAWGLARWSLADTAVIRWCNPLLAGDAEAERILADQRLPVFIGNPPYSNFGKQNRGPWIDSLLADYKSGVTERKVNLADDFIKFIRWSQHWVDRAGQGVVVLVTSNTYLHGLTQRGMRASLLKTFDELHFLNLHGEPADIRDSAVDGNDENIFPVRSGVAIALLVKAGRADAAKVVRYGSVRGSRRDKFAWLAANPFGGLESQSIQPQAPNFFFKQSAAPALSTLRADYNNFWPLTRIFQQWISGVQTKNDALLVDFDRDTLAARIRSYLSTRELSSSGESPIAFDAARIVPYLLAPFDRRWLYYDPRLVGRARESVLRHMLRPNIGLVFMRQSTNAGEYDHALAVDCLVSDRVFYSRHGAPYCAPLWLYGDELSQPPVANLQPAWLVSLATIAGRPVTPEESLDYAYAVLHRQDYRTAFGSELRIDFPRIPLPTSSAALTQHVHIGKRLRSLHTKSGQRPHKVSAAQQLSAEQAGIGGYVVLQRWRTPRRNHGDIASYDLETQRISQILASSELIKQELNRCVPPWRP